LRLLNPPFAKLETGGNEMQSRRFIVAEWGMDEDDPMHLYMCDETKVSRLYDESDLHGEAFTVWTMNKAANGFVTVSLTNGRRRINTDVEMPFRFAETDLITSEGEIVGVVTWTDH